MRNGGICIIGERLYELRKDADLTQDELATILNINKHSISSYERDKSEPPDVIKIAIAQYFDVSVDYLLDLTDNPSPAIRTRKIIRLPDAFPENMLSELNMFIDYLVHKKKQTK